ncbi:MAG: acyl-CoA thioesterase [Burkholderiales bacterium]|nr:acyl-CoA thioesterase [Burkholderiales bacterium]
MSSKRLLVHTSHQAVRWGDMDALGHVNNTVYFRYMEQARLEWLYTLVGAGGYTAGQGPVIANALCNFRRPLVYPAPIEVRMYLGAPGTTSVASYYDIVAGGTTYADGESTIVWIDVATGRPQPLPATVVEPLRAYLEEPS